MNITFIFNALTVDNVFAKSTMFDHFMRTVKLLCQTKNDQSTRYLENCVSISVPKAWLV